MTEKDRVVRKRERHRRWTTQRGSGSGATEEKKEPEVQKRLVEETYRQENGGQ